MHQNKEPRSKYRKDPRKTQFKIKDGDCEPTFERKQKMMGGGVSTERKIRKMKIKIKALIKKSSLFRVEKECGGRKEYTGRRVASN